MTLLAWLLAALWAAPGALAQTPPDRAALETLMEPLLGDDPDAHDAALAELVAMGEGAAPELEAMASDATVHPRFRAGAIYALGRIGAPSSRAVLETLWAAGVEQLGGALSIQVASALSDYGELDALRQMVEVPDEILAAKASIQLGLLGDTEALERVQAAYDNPETARMRPFFAIALGLLGDGRGEAVLREGLETMELRDHCAVALAHLGYGQDVVFQLEFAFANRDPLVRLAALRALADLGSPGLDDLLEQAAEDSDARVRDAARELGRTGRRERNH